MEHPFFKQKVVVFAHRGDSQYFPENTLPAFKSAAELKVDCIETDVHLTLDGTCVVWHDDTLENLTGDTSKICAHTLKELTALDAGKLFSPDRGATFPFRNRGIRIATLEEVLEALPEMRFNIDLKDNSTKLVKEFVRVVTKHNAVNRILGASFHHGNLLLLRKLLPEMVTSFSEKEAFRIVISQKTGLLPFKRHYQAAALQVPEYSGKIHVVTRRLLRTLHRRGILLHVWTVNDRDTMKRLLDMGVDGIFTDNPRLLIHTIQERLQ